MIHEWISRDILFSQEFQMRIMARNQKIWPAFVFEKSGFLSFCGLLGFLLRIKQNVPVIIQLNDQVQWMKVGVLLRLRH